MFFLHLVFFLNSNHCSFRDKKKILKYLSKLCIYFIMYKELEMSNFILVPQLVSCIFICFHCGLSFKMIPMYGAIMIVSKHHSGLLLHHIIYSSRCQFRFVTTSRLPVYFFFFFVHGKTLRCNNVFIFILLLLTNMEFVVLFSCKMNNHGYMHMQIISIFLCSNIYIFIQKKNNEFYHCYI